MEFLRRMAEAVDLVEAHLGEDMDLDALARIAQCDAYQFGRIFAYVVGMPLSEYIRRRRLSLAALALAEGGRRVIDVALDFGYRSPDAFARAFRELHGISPREARPGARLKLQPRISLHIHMGGYADMEYRIERMPRIEAAGIERNFGRWQADEGAEDWQNKMGDVWTFWDDFLDRGANLILRDKYRLYRAPLWQFGWTRTTDEGDTIVSIGAQADGREYPELTRFTVPEHTWAVFPARGRLNQKTHPISAVLTRALAEWLPASGYDRAGSGTMECYGPGDTNSDDYVCELWLPIVKKT